MGRACCDDRVVGLAKVEGNLALFIYMVLDVM